MKVTFLGDVHGRWADMYARMGENLETEQFVQVGDFGHLPGLGSYIPQGCPTPLDFIDGNHEDHFDLAERVIKGDLEMAPNINYIPRGTQKVYGSTKVNFCGGAESVDRDVRITGRDWFPTEIPSYEEMSRFMGLPDADVWVTHNAPKFIIEPISHYKVKDPTNKMFEFAWQETGHKPEIWFFGHYHKHIDETVEGTRFVCLPCVHDHYYFDEIGRDVPIKGFKGVTLDL
jgi:hypothetical protein